MFHSLYVKTRDKYSFNHSMSQQIYSQILHDYIKHDPNLIAGPCVFYYIWTDSIYLL